MIAEWTKTILRAGTAIIGKIRLVDSQGAEVTEGGAVKVTVTSDHIQKSLLVDSDGEQLEQLNTVVKELPIAYTLGDDRVTITTAGARQPLRTTPTPCKWVIVTAETDNGSKFVVGGPTVIAVLATRQGTPLDPGDSAIIPINDVSKVFGDAEVAGEGATLMWGL